MQSLPLSFQLYTFNSDFKKKIQIGRKPATTKISRPNLHKGVKKKKNFIIPAITWILAIIYTVQVNIFGSKVCIHLFHMHLSNNHKSTKNEMTKHSTGVRKEETLHLSAQIPLKIICFAFYSF